MVLARSVVVAALAAVCVGIVQLSASAAAAQTVVTLEVLESRAVSDNPSLEAREARVRAAAARVDAVMADMRPRLTLDMGVQASPGAIIRQPDCDQVAEGEQPCYVRGQAVSGSGATAFIPSTIPSAILRYEGVLYDFGRTRARRRATEAEVAAQEAELDAAEEAIVHTVRTAYLNWLAAHQRSMATRAELAVAAQRVQDIERALASGARSASDRDSAGIEATRLRLELSRAQSAEGTARRLLARIVGETLPEDAVPDVAILARDAPVRMTREDRQARVLELRREIAIAGRRAYDLRHAPVLSMSLQSAAAVQFAYGVDPIFIPSYQAQIGLSIPLWDPRAQSFIADEAIAQAEALDAAALEQRATATHAEDEARRRLSDVDAEIVLAQEIVTATERAAAGAEERYRVAGGSIEAVLTAQERARRAREDLMRSRLDRTDAVLRLLPVR